MAPRWQHGLGYLCLQLVMFDEDATISSPRWSHGKLVAEGYSKQRQSLTQIKKTDARGTSHSLQNDLEVHIRVEQRLQLCKLKPSRNIGDPCHLIRIRQRRCLALLYVIHVTLICVLINARVRIRVRRSILHTFSRTCRPANPTTNLEKAVQRASDEESR